MENIMDLTELLAFIEGIDLPVSEISPVSGGRT
jgi:hypothetical protein